MLNTFASRIMNVVKNKYFAEPIDPSQDELVRGYSFSDLEQEFSMLFARADPSDSGRLDAFDFRKELTNADFDLSQRELTVLLCEAEEDGDGMISYKKFIGKIHRLLYYVQKFDEIDDI